MDFINMLGVVEGQLDFKEKTDRKELLSSIISGSSYVDFYSGYCYYSILTLKYALNG